jgi:hypothetical protein
MAMDIMVMDTMAVLVQVFLALALAHLTLLAKEEI